MKLVKYFLIAATIYLVWQRPFVPIHFEKTKVTLPEHVSQQLGTQAGKALHGIDISHFQGAVNFNSVAESGIKFVYLKATQGTDFVDPTYQDRISALQQLNSNNKQLKKEPLLHGAYHFYQPAQDPVAQAQFFLKQVQNHKHSLPPMLDVEISQGTKPEEIQKGVTAWLAYVQQALNCKPILYSYGDFWTENLGAEFNSFPFWLADYAPHPSVPKGLLNWRLWQYQDKGRVPGIESTVDLDVLLSGEIGCHV